MTIPTFQRQQLLHEQQQIRLQKIKWQLQLKALAFQNYFSIILIISIISDFLKLHASCYPQQANGISNGKKFKSWVEPPKKVLQIM